MNVNNESSKSARNAQERRKSNLAFAFFCLGKDRARDMEIFYAFCRLMDDIADECGPSVEEKRAELGKWKDEIRAIYEDKGKELSPLGVELKELIGRRDIPQAYMLDIIAGVERDTDNAPFETFEDIRKYCYGVASAVGLASIYIFGFTNNRTKLFAEALGYALQFTNILRDVVDDIRTQNRVYIPSQELAAFGVSREDLRDPSKNPNCKELFRFMYFRAKHFFNKARRLLPDEDRKSMAPAFIMWAIYEHILETLKSRDFDIPAKPLKISKAKKIFLALDAIRRARRRLYDNRKFGKVLIAGAGISGMTAALRLAEEGFDVDLYEASAHVGGRAASIEWNGARLDNATHALMGCYTNMLGTLAKLGGSGPEFFSRVKGMDFLSPDGRKIEIEFPSADASKLKKFFAFLSYRKLDGFLTFRNVLLMLRIKFGFAGAGRRETAAAFLRRMGVKRTEDFWSMFCVSALNTTLENASARLLVSTLSKSILKGGDAGMLIFPRRTIADAYFPRIKTYIEGVGGRIYLNEGVRKVFMGENRIRGVSTTKCDFAACDIFVSALNIGALKQLLGPQYKLISDISKISENNILNIYFSTPKKLFGGDYACLLGSRLHWVFDHTGKVADNPRGLNLYGVTVSADGEVMSKADAEKLVKEELSKFFGDFEVADILPMVFRGSTISADCRSESLRPNDAQAQYLALNFHICGDWVKTGLPCTMESAAKSANDIFL